MTILLDTDVLIECLRASPKAIAWMKQEAGTPFEVPGIVGMEIIVGCRNKRELQRTRRFLKMFPVAWPTAEEFATATEILAEHRLRDGVGIPDSILAAMARVRGARLLTFNLKHFRNLAGVDARAPYAR
jgi:hypothetical protein